MTQAKGRQRQDDLSPDPKRLSKHTPQGLLRSMGRIGLEQAAQQRQSGKICLETSAAAGGESHRIACAPSCHTITMTAAHVTTHTASMLREHQLLQPLQHTRVSIQLLPLTAVLSCSTLSWRAILVRCQRLASCFWPSVMGSRNLDLNSLALMNSSSGCTCEQKLAAG